MKNFSISREKGFTLLELMVVVGVLAVLAGTLLLILNPLAQLGKSRDAKRKSDLANIQKALEQYYNDHGNYPQNTANYNIKDPADCNPSPCAWGSSSWMPYMTKLPQDPNNPSSTDTYVYFAPVGGQTYYLYANLDRGGSDPQACFSNGNACTNATANGIANKCVGNCNYGVTSSNTTP